MLKLYHKHLVWLLFIKQLNNRMKKLFVLLSFFFALQTISAQLFSKEKIKNNENFDKSFLSWGYFLGFNNYDFNFDYNQNLADIQVLKSVGFNVGLIGNLRINEFLDLRLEPGLSISKRELNYHSSYFQGMSFNDNDLLHKQIDYIF